MKKQYKIYRVDTINVDPEVILGDYGYGSTTIRPTILRELYQEDFGSEDTFNSLEEAEYYIKENLIKEYGETYTILTEYSYGEN